MVYVRLLQLQTQCQCPGSRKVGGEGGHYGREVALGKDCGQLPQILLILWMLRVIETPVVQVAAQAEMTRIIPFKFAAGLFRVRLGIYLLFTNFRFRDC